METCKVEGCARPHKAGGYCAMHYARWKRHGDPLVVLPRRGRQHRKCTIEDCDGEHYGHGYCVKHYTRWRTHGDPHISLRAPAGAGTIRPDGYRSVTVDGERMLEQRHVMEEFLERKLDPWEIIKFADGDRLNINISNLILVEQSHPEDNAPEAFWAWLAGFFDGDGSVGIYGEEHRVMMCFANTSLILLKEVQSAVGGKIRTRLPKGHLGKKPCGWLNLSSRMAVNCLEHMLPYLHLKKRRAEIALQAYHAKPKDRAGLAEEMRALIGSEDELSGK